MAKLSDNAENALNETRMLILGAQVLIGFDFQAVFLPAFGRLPPATQDLKLFGLGMLLVAVGLLITPGAFHQIVERGNDTPRLLDFTGRIAACALLPFALAIGNEVYIAVDVIVGDVAALAISLFTAVFALFFWYGLGLIWRARLEALSNAQKEQRMAEPTSLETKIKQVLTEARVVLPGVQALLGFQLSAMFTDAFAQLPRSSQYLHLTSLSLLAISMIFLMSPAAFHRIVEHGEDTERLHRFSSAMLLAAMVPLALGLAGDFFVVLDKVLGAQTVAIGLATTSLVFFFGLWFGLTLAIRARSQPRGSLRVSRAAR